MKALTLTQPWATLVAIGAKRIETRSWSTKYRGWLAIHAAKKIPTEYQSLWLRDPFLSALCGAGVVSVGPATIIGADAVSYQLNQDRLPLGCVVAVCKVVRCWKIGKDDGIPEPEHSFGDYTPGRYAWLLTNIRMLSEPIPAKGALGLWEWNYPY